MTAPAIASIFQLYLRRINENAYNFAFILKMTDGSYCFREKAISLDQTRDYLAKHGWSDYLPERDGQVIGVVYNGEILPRRPA
jgi:hypothetical protein